MKVVLAAHARSDLIRIGDFIALDNPGRARSFVLDLRKACVSLRDNSMRYSYLSGFENRGLRRRPVGNYLIIYDVGDNLVTIHRILNAAQDLSFLLGSDLGD